MCGCIRLHGQKSWHDGSRTRPPRRAAPQRSCQQPRRAAGASEIRRFNSIKANKPPCGTTTRGCKAGELPVKLSVLPARNKSQYVPAHCLWSSTAARHGVRAASLSLLTQGRSCTAGPGPRTSAPWARARACPPATPGPVAEARHRTALPAVGPPQCATMAVTACSTGTQVIILAPKQYVAWYMDLS